MRTFSFICVLLFAASVPAQSRSIVKQFNDGTRYAAAGAYDKALPKYRAALEASVSDSVDLGFMAKLHYDLGVCEYKLDMPDDAVMEFKLAIEYRSGDYSKAHYALGMVHLENQRWTEAEDAFLAAIRLDNNNGEAWFDLAFAYLGQSDLEHAESAFRAAIALNSVDSAWAHNNIGVLQAVKGDLPAAEKEFEAAIRTSDGRLAAPRNNLEYCRSNTGSVQGIAIRHELSIGRRQNSVY